MKRLIIILILLLFPIINRGNVSVSWWQVYFTTPCNNKLQHIQINPEKGIIELINNASESFYGAFYDVSFDSIVKSLIKAKLRGVDVKIITESDNYDRRGITDLIRAGIPVVIDKRSGLMHNKFAIIDGRIVWTGSYNLTENDSKLNNNNAIAIIFPDLADIFLRKFNEMFLDNTFGNKSYSGILEFIQQNKIIIDISEILVYFSPEDEIESIIMNLLKDAHSSIHFMAFSFTSDKIGDAMVDMYIKGIKVTGVFEKIGSGTKYSEFAKMKAAGIPVYLDKNPHMMHHKVIIIDGRIVIIGSFNFSKNANDNNDENILIIYNETIAREYIDELLRLIK